MNTWSPEKVWRIYQQVTIENKIIALIFFKQLLLTNIYNKYTEAGKENQNVDIMGLKGKKQPFCLYKTRHH